MTQKEKQLALKWVNGELRLADIARKLGGKNNKAYSFLARALKEVIRPK